MFCSKVAATTLIQDIGNYLPADTTEYSSILAS
jgi:hypothetical protein